MEPLCLLHAEEDGEAGAAAELGGAAQPGGPDPVRVGAQRPRVVPRRAQRPGPGVLLPHPVAAAAAALLLQRRAGQRQEGVRVPHQLHQEVGGQVRRSRPPRRPLRVESHIC